MNTADEIAAALRPIAPGGKLTTLDVPFVNALAANWMARKPAVAVDPPWIVAARARIGIKEIPGPQHNKWIVEMWRRIGWPMYTTDEVPWCGGFLASCMLEAGITPPKMSPRAKDWGLWGVECSPQVGAVAVMEREGGGHVTLLVGQSGVYYKGLGANQSNAVNIMDFPKSRITKIRWPIGVPQSKIALPEMARGTVSQREA